MGLVRGDKTTGELLRESWELAFTNGGDAGRRTFEELFALGPNVQAMSEKADQEELRELFGGALQFIVMNYERRPLVERMLRELGRRHVQYGVRPEHYGVFGECLLRALKKASGERWSIETELLWRTVYEDIADVMAQGAAEAA